MMKKYITMAVAAIAAITFCACSNDDIQIDQALTVRINPASVVSSFTYEVNQGDLTSFDSNFRLRTRLLVYDAEGKRVFSQKAMLKNYTETMTVNPNLPDGSYTMVAVTDVVVADNESEEYWTLSGEDELSKAVITYKGVVGFKRAILGIEGKKVTISASNRVFDLHPTAAGALLCVTFKGYKKFSNLVQLQFLANQEPGACSFDASGSWTASFNKFMERDANVLKSIYHFNPSTENSQQMAAYIFTLPGATSVRFAHGYQENGNTSAHYAGERIDMTLARGAEYEILLDYNTVSDLTAVTPTYSLKSGGSASRVATSARLEDLM